MKYNKIVLVIFSLIMLMSCYEDKGTYNYKEVEEIALLIAVPEDSSFEVIIGEPLKRVAVIISQETNEEVNYDDYTFEWAFDFTFDNVLSDKREFEMAFDKLHEGTLILKVTNKYNGNIKTSESFYTVRAPYQGAGWLILGEKDGKTELSIVKDVVYNTQEIIRDIYTKANPGKELGAEPIQIREHWGNGAKHYGNFLILTEKEGVDIEPNTYNLDINLKEAILGDSYTEGMYFRNSIFMHSDYSYGGVDILEDQNGRLYSRIRENIQSIHSGLFIMQPLTYTDNDTNKEEVLEDCRLIMAPLRSASFVLVHDNKNKRLLGITGQNTWSEKVDPDAPQIDYNTSLVNAGRVWAIPPYPQDSGGGDKRKRIKKSGPDGGGNEVVPEGFVPLNDLSGYDVKLIGRYDPWGSAGPIGYSMILEKDGEYFIQQFELGYMSGVFNVSNTKFTKINGIPAGSTPDCFFKLPLIMGEIFISIGKDLYTASIETGLLDKYYTFKSNIIKIDTPSEVDVVGVALEDGTFYLINGQSPKTLLDDEKIILDIEEHNFGRIVDFHYIIGNGTYF